MSDETTLIGTGRLARMLDISPQRVGQLVTAGVLVRQGRGRFEVDASVRSYIHFLRSQPFGSDGSGAALDYAAERARLTKLTADKVECELTVMQRRLVSIDDVVAPFADACSVIRQKYLALPARVAMRIVGMTERQAFKLLYDEVCAILTELSTFAEAHANADDAVAEGGDDHD